MAVFFLERGDLVFPPVDTAEPDGLLALTRDLTPERIIAAYARGIFPWYEQDGLFFWYSPHPRMVLFPTELRVHKSMRSIFNQNKFCYTLDTAFEQVIEGCAHSLRKSQSGTWISPRFIEVYTALHREGLAHSVEVWQGNALVGGLYGISLGRVFFGESMFTRISNASKAGFIALVRALEQSGFDLVDCQQASAHLKSLGGRTISRAEFAQLLARNDLEATLRGRWRIEGGKIVATH